MPAFPAAGVEHHAIVEIRRKLAPYCRRHGITQLEIFGSTARGEAGRRSDVDLIATFQLNPGLGFFAMEEEDAVAITHLGVLRAAYTLASGWNMATPMPAELDTSKILLLEMRADGKPAIHQLNIEFEKL